MATWHDIQHPFLSIEYLAAGNEVDGTTLEQAALVIDTDEVAVFGSVAGHPELLAFARRLLAAVEAGPKAPPLRCTECMDEVGSVSSAGLCSDCETEANLAGAR